jgi:6-phosphogluconolactonase
VEVEELPTPEDVAERCAAVLATAIQAGARNVTLTGGTSPLRAYELLGPMVDDWSAVHLWYGDERCVPPSHPDSNHRQASARLEAPGATWHPIHGELGPYEGAAAYGRELDGTPLDVTLLGLGPDGHIASLFPDHPLLDAEGVALGLEDSPKPPPERITLSLPKLNESARIVLIVTGAAKADALARVLGEPNRHTPGSLLARDRLLVLADAAAMGDARG